MSNLQTRSSSVYSPFNTSFIHFRFDLLTTSFPACAANTQVSAANVTCNTELAAYHSFCCSVIHIWLTDLIYHLNYALLLFTSTLLSLPSSPRAEPRATAELLFSYRLLRGINSSLITEITVAPRSPFPLTCSNAPQSSLWRRAETESRLISYHNAILAELE